MPTCRFTWSFEVPSWHAKDTSEGSRRKHSLYGNLFVIFQVPSRSPQKALALIHRQQLKSGKDRYPVTMLPKTCAPIVHVPPSSAQGHTSIFIQKSSTSFLLSPNQSIRQDQQILYGLEDMLDNDWTRQCFDMVAGQCFLVVA